ncbi:MAG: 3-dehydroquinate synthase [Planctomycetota bacterium]|nr:MAG: 3-dehydroquinate synthase [Planctomycetota bacterium]
MTDFLVERGGGPPYPVRVGRDLAAGLAWLREAAGPATRIALVCDERVAGLYAAAVEDRWPEARRFTVPPGEDSKSPERLVEAWRFLRDRGCDRSSLVLALGGGVVGDLAGFAAATYMRGIRIAHLPTSLLAMADSALGGKTAINLGAKNLVGAFHAPVAVLCHLPFLASLPPREVRCGLGEVWKTGVLRGEPLWSLLEAKASRLRALDLDALEPVVRACLEHKARVVARDEREAGERALLNFGHTLGHALELLDPGLSHGEAVAVGGAFALELAQRLGRLEPTAAERLLACARALGLPSRPTRPVDPEAAWELLLRDKKARGGTLRWVLPRGLGELDLVDDVPAERARELLAGFLC